MKYNIDLFVNKKQTVERAFARIDQHYAHNPESLQNLDHQDVIILNIQRACEAVIDFGNHLIAQNTLEVAQSSRDVFQILERADFIEQSLSSSLKAMVGFRNLAVHRYQEIDLQILQAILESHLPCLLSFFDQING